MEAKELLEQLTTDLRGFIEKSKDEMKSLGLATTETKSAITTVQTQIANLQKQLDVVDARQQHPGAGGKEEKSIAEQLRTNEQLQAYIRNDSKGAKIHFPDVDLDGFIAKGREQKTLITSTAVGSATSGALLFERTPGIVPLAMRRLRLRQLFSAAPTDRNAIDYVKISSFSKVVSPVSEGSAKGESELKFATVSVPVRLIATWIPATKVILDDFSGLDQLIREQLTFALEEEIEDQILSGNNTSENLNGLTTQATAFDTSLTVASDGWEKVDLVARAIQQVNVANEIDPDFVVLNPTDSWGMRLVKDTAGRYVFDRPDGARGASPLWGLTPVVTTAMTSGYFLVGSSAPTAAVIRNRMGVTIDISDSHDDYFIKNKIAIRIEARLALVVFRPASYIYGALDTSPA